MIERNSNSSVNWSKYILTSLRNTHYWEIRHERRGVATLACAADYAALPQAYGTGRSTIVSSGKTSKKNQRNEPIATRLNAKRPHDAPSRTSSTIQLVRNKYIERQQRRRIFQKSWKKKTKTKGSRSRLNK